MIPEPFERGARVLVGAGPAPAAFCRFGTGATVSPPNGGVKTSRAELGAIPAAGSVRYCRRARDLRSPEPRPLPMPSAPLESTVSLLERIRRGDAVARDRLVARYLPVLRAWAHGRLPAHARGLADTDDVVQITLIRALNHLEGFEYRHDGALLGYLRQGVLNAIRQEIRRARRKPPGEELDDSLADAAPSALEQAVGREFLDRYEAALLELTPDQREAAILRLEFGLSYPEIDAAMGRNHPNAARMLVVRALVTLAERLGHA